MLMLTSYFSATQRRSPTNRRVSLLFRTEARESGHKIGSILLAWSNRSNLENLGWTTKTLAIVALVQLVQLVQAKMKINRKNSITYAKWKYENYPPRANEPAE
jgi:hypothetical protein